MMLFMIVVFPVPGPPVIIVTLFSLIALIASFCFSERIISVFSSIIFNSFSMFDTFFIFLALSNALILSAICCSALKNVYKYISNIYNENPNLSLSIK